MSTHTDRQTNHSWVARLKNQHSLDHTSLLDIYVLSVNGGCHPEGFIVASFNNQVETYSIHNQSIINISLALLVLIRITLIGP